MTNDELICGRGQKALEVPSVLGGCRSAYEWVHSRRHEVREMLEREMFGKVPPLPAVMKTELVREKVVFEGKGIRREVRIVFQNGDVEHAADLLWYLPASATAEHPVPLIVALNFQGNAGCTFEEDIPLREGEKRGSAAHRWPFEYLLEQGVSVMTAQREDFFPDRKDGEKDSIWRLFAPMGKERRGTAISAWAWGNSRMLEVGMQEPRIDRTQIWCHGHSRLGKTALWTGANDSRFAGIVSNDSGCCGAALMREKHDKAEHIAQIDKMFPHWFVSPMDAWQNREEELPFDAHWLIALSAPRPVLVCSATEDIWADPFNEFRATCLASPVYNLFGAKGLPLDTAFPEADCRAFGEGLGYSLREGEHNVKLHDWDSVLKFMKH